MRFSLSLGMYKFDEINVLNILINSVCLFIERKKEIKREIESCWRGCPPPHLPPLSPMGVIHPLSMDPQEHLLVRGSKGPNCHCCVSLLGKEAVLFWGSLAPAHSWILLVRAIQLQFAAARCGFEAKRCQPCQWRHVPLVSCWAKPVPNPSSTC